MKHISIKNYLRPQSIYGRRSTSISHAFASAVVPLEIYDEQKVRERLSILGQDPDNLTCVYCNDEAETYDHLVNLVRDKLPNGGGHQIGNLVPCCHRCNSKKGSKDWQEYLQETIPASEYESRKAQIESYQAGTTLVDLGRMETEHPDDYRKFWGIRDQILSLMHEADEIAKRLR